MELQNRSQEIQALGAKVVAVSVDPVEKSKSLADQLQLGFPILQDRDHTLGSAFGVFRLPGGMAWETWTAIPSSSSMLAGTSAGRRSRLTPCT